MKEESLEQTSPDNPEDLPNGQNRVLELIVSGKSLSEILTALVRLIESQVPDMICTILLLDEDGVRLRNGAAPNLPPGLSDAIDGSSIGPKAGSCGTAAFRGEPVYVEDIATDPLWEDYRNVFLLRGLRACWSQPIFDQEHRVLGTFAIYFRHPARPEGLHLRLIDIATHIAAVAIIHRRTQDKLRRNEQQLQLIYDTVGDGIVLLEVQPDKRFRFASVNQAFLSATGLKPEQVFGKYIDKFIPPSAQEVVFTNYWKAIREKQPLEFEEESIYPSGRKKAVVLVSPVFDANGVCKNLVCVLRNWQEAS